jgi:AraC-like DNA-binding protein
MVSTITATVVARAFDVGVRHGVPAAELEAVLGRHRADLVDGARVPMPPMYALFAHCLRHTDDPSFPLRVAEAVTLEDYAVLGFGLMTASSAEESLERLRRFGHLVSDSGAWRMGKVGAAGVELRWVRSGARTLGHRAANECAIAELVGGLRRGFGRALAPRRVMFRHPPPADLRAHATFFRAPIAWRAPHDGVVLPGEILARTPTSAHPTMSKFFGDVLERSGQPRATASARVRAALAERLSSGPPTAAQLAAHLGMSERSLRRALAAEAATFRMLLDELRRTTARELLDAGTSVTEIAFLLGFSETSALSRAFRRWHGASPRSSKPRAR